MTASICRSSAWRIWRGRRQQHIRKLHALQKTGLKLDKAAANAKFKTLLPPDEMGMLRNQALITVVAELPEKYGEPDADPFEELRDPVPHLVHEERRVAAYSGASRKKSSTRRGRRTRTRTPGETSENACTEMISVCTDTEGKPGYSDQLPRHRGRAANQPRQEWLCRQSISSPSSTPWGGAWRVGARYTICKTRSPRGRRSSRTSAEDLDKHDAIEIDNRNA